MPSHVLSVLFQILFYSTQWLYTKIIFYREKVIKTWYSLLNKYHISYSTADALVEMLSAVLRIISQVMLSAQGLQFRKAKMPI